MDVMADEWDLKEWTFGTSKRNEAFDSYVETLLINLNNAYKHLFKSAQSQVELDAIYEGLTERPDEEGIKMLNGRTQNNLHWFTSDDDSNKKTSQVLVQTHKRRVLQFCLRSSLLKILDTQ